MLYEELLDYNSAAFLKINIKIKIIFIFRWTNFLINDAIITTLLCVSDLFRWLSLLFSICYLLLFIYGLMSLSLMLLSQHWLLRVTASLDVCLITWCSGNFKWRIYFIYWNSQRSHCCFFRIVRSDHWYADDWVICRESGSGLLLLANETSLHTYISHSSSNGEGSWPYRTSRSALSSL